MSISLLKNTKSFSKDKIKKHKHSGEAQGALLKIFKKTDEFFSRVGFTRSNIYFKIRLHTFLWIFSTSKTSTLTSSYFRTNFKLLTKLFKANVNIFGEKSKNICFMIFHPCLDNFVYCYPLLRLLLLDNYLVWRTLSSAETFI